MANRYAILVFLIKYLGLLKKKLNKLLIWWYIAGNWKIPKNQIKNTKITNMETINKIKLSKKTR